MFREDFVGPYRASAALGALVGPYGLREVGRLLEAMKERGPSTVLIRGETGSGKELLAREVASRLGRAKRYVAVNVAGIAEGVFESQLFGHVAGAFSGAGKASKGLVVSHDGGAVFLDELGELAMGLQAKLLRLVEQGEVLPVGASAPVTVDVALIAATNAPLERMVAEGRFRQDLLARLEPWTLSLPPLWARREDVFAIAQALAPSIGIALSPDRCEVEAVERLLLEGWPTNVRGLVAALTKVRAIDPEAGLRLWALEKVLGPVRRAAPGEVDEAAALEAVEACGGNESEAARVLGISRGRLRRLTGKA